MHVTPAQNSKPGVVIPFYAAGAIAFFIAAVLTFLSRESFFGHYFQPHLLAITHLLALGWGTMIIFGALHQFIPVLLEVPLFSQRLGKWTFVFMVCGVTGLVYSFWKFDAGLPMQISSMFLFSAVALFCLNISRTARAAKSWKTSADFILTSVVWLFLTVLSGTVLVFNFRYLFLPESQLYYLKLHAHLGLAGWFLQLIIGVSSRLIPMFLLSPPVPERKLTTVYHFINFGLLSYVSNILIFKANFLTAGSVILVCIGIMIYGHGLRQSFLKRVRKNVDAGMKESLLAFLLLSLPLLILIAVLVFDPAEKSSLMFYTAYGFAILFGFISTLILGQVYKTLPFIVWLKLKKDNSSFKTLPKDFYSEQLAKWQLFIHSAGISISLLSLLLKLELVFTIGALLIIVSAIAFIANLFKILYQLTLKT